MVTRDGSSVRRLALPLKGWFQRFAFALLLAAAFGLMVLGRADNGFVARLRITIADAVMPVLDALSRPIATTDALVERGRALVALYAENERLRDENARLHRWQAVALELERQNVGLRDLLNVVDGPRPTFVTARVIADSGGAFVRTVMINAGARDGVREGQAVVNGDGLVGRVVEVGKRSARVLLLIDLNARVPVLVQSTRVPAILAGDNSERPRLALLPADSQVAPGQRIVTSGQGGMLPPGLPVGIVVAVDESGATVRAFVDWYRLEYVRILDYALPGILPTTRIAGRVGPLR